MLLLYDEYFTVELKLERLKILPQRLDCFKTYFGVALVDLGRKVAVSRLAPHGDLTCDYCVQHLVFYWPLDNVRPADRAPEIFRLLLKELNTAGAKRVSALKAHHLAALVFAGRTDNAIHYFGVVVLYLLFAA